MFPDSAHNLNAMESLPIYQTLEDPTMDQLTVIDLKKIAMDIPFSSYMVNDRAMIIQDLLSRGDDWHERLMVEAFHKRQTLLDQDIMVPRLTTEDQFTMPPLRTVYKSRDQDRACSIVSRHLDATQDGEQPIIYWLHVY